MASMLIINADDLGRSTAETDRALACFRRGSINAATAMVFMADSQRAAALATESGIDSGLHLNLSEEFSEAAAPRELRERHARVRRFLRSNRYALVLYHPLLASDFEYVVKAQLEEYERLFARPVQRLDGHQHMHLATNVLWQRLLPAGIRVRRSFSFLPGERSGPNLWYRRRVDALLAKRHRLTDAFFDISRYLEPTRMQALRARAADETIELMTHPVRDTEYRFLTTDAFEPLARIGTEAAAPWRAAVDPSMESA